MIQRHSNKTRPSAMGIPILAAALAAGAALPAHAENEELAALKRLLEQQQQALQQQQKQIERLEQQIAAQSAAKPEAPAAAGGNSGGLLPNVKIYGILDSGVEHISNIGSGHNDLTRVPPITGTVGSRLGFQAEKEIRPGLKGIATLEAGFNLDNGTLGQGGRIFGRQLFAGFSTPYGDFTYGRQYSMLIYAMGDSDLLGPNIYGLGSLDAYLPNARFDNSLSWRGKFGKVALGATYSFGRDTQGSTPASGTCAGEVPGNYQTCHAWSAMARYDTDMFGLDVAIDEQHGGTGATASFFNGAAGIAFANSSDTDRRITAGGYLKLGNAKLGLGWLGRKLDTASTDVKSDIYYLDGAYNFSPEFTLDGGIQRITNKDQDRDATLYALRGFYNFDKNLSAYLQYGHIQNSSQAQYALSLGPGVGPTAGGNQNGYMIGARYRF